MRQTLAAPLTRLRGTGTPVSAMEHPLPRSKRAALDPIGSPWIFFGVALAVTVAGFWPSFFAVLPTAKRPHLIHGFSATAWMLLPLLQAWFIQTNRRRAHRWVGWASLPLAGVVAVSGLHVVQIMAVKNAQSFNLLSVKFVLLDLTGIALFCVCVALSIAAARHRDIGRHVRWIACSALIPLEAALERLFINLFPRWVPDFEAGLTAALLSLELLLALLIAIEWRRDRVRLPFPLLLGYYLVMHVILAPVAGSASFQAFANWFASL